MKKYSVIERGIAEGNIDLLRGALGNICYTNRNFSNGEFDEVLQYIEQKGIKIKEDSLKGNLVSEGKEKFSENDFGDAVFELKENFCDERIADVKKIGRAVYGGSNDSPKPSQETPKDTHPKKERSHQKPQNSKTAMWILVAVVLILIVIYLVKKQ